MLEQSVHGSIFIFYDSTLEIRQCKWRTGTEGGMDSSVALNFIPRNDSFYSTLLHLQVGVNITLPLGADGWVKKHKKLIWNKLTTLHPEEGAPSLPGHFGALCRVDAELTNSVLLTARLVNLPTGEQPQSAARINNQHSSKAGNEYCSNNSKLALPECFKGEATSCSSQTVTFSLQKRD